MSGGKQRDDRCFVNPHLGDESCRVPTGSEDAERRQPQVKAGSDVTHDCNVDPFVSCSFQLPCWAG